MTDQLNAYGFSDAAKRCSDIVSMHSFAGSVGKFVAIRLEDGGTDGVVYDTWRDAVSHQLSPEYCCYIKVQPGGMTAKEAQVFLNFWRQAYDAGFRQTDPDMQAPLMPLTARDQKRQIRALTKR